MLPPGTYLHCVIYGELVLLPSIVVFFSIFFILFADDPQQRHFTETQLAYIFTIFSWMFSIVGRVHRVKTVDGEVHFLKSWPGVVLFGFSGKTVL